MPSRGRWETMKARYLLEMLSAFQVDEEIWLVLENADGGDLFSRLPESRRTIMCSCGLGFGQLCHLAKLCLQSIVVAKSLNSILMKLFFQLLQYFVANPGAKQDSSSS